METHGFDFEFLNACLKSLGLAADDGAQQKLAMLYGEIIAYNDKVNLTSIIEEKDFIIKHIADSLTAAKHIPLNATVCDIGPGGGFPSVPLKILRGDLDFTLFEASGKKTDFINGTAKLLKLDGFKCLHMRAEDAARTVYRERFGIALARAVAPLNTLLEYAAPLLKKGGGFIAYKTASADGEITAASNAAKLLGCGEPYTEEIVLPYTDIKRTLVVYPKAHASPAIYPRGGNKERSNPL
ncbi:MAG: 16S rRNA (guanine(527)-N(7))-methyltransferase RsmG [Clostridiales bacterium]|jgi:16S rRNA (guanine527-N7)-methyltransferase|nr:16S rRNA (guanine(527)-N(7))-methyltransferase RsmG [Clostridiales bacterium]